MPSFVFLGKLVKISYLPFTILSLSLLTFDVSWKSYVGVTSLSPPESLKIIETPRGPQGHHMRPGEGQAYWQMKGNLSREGDSQQ